MMTKTILWDADGVLFQSYDINGVFFWSAHVQQDLGIPIDQVKDIFAAGWNDVLRGIKDTRQHIASVFAMHNIEVSVDAYIDYWLAKDTRINEDVARFLHPEHSHIATNQDPLRTQRIGQILEKRFNKIFASSAIKAMKPEADYYAYIEADLKQEPQTLCLIDDNLYNVDAAHKRGWHAHHFTNVERLVTFLNSY